MKIRSAVALMITLASAIHLPGFAKADGLAGPYLAGVQASMRNDYVAAARYFNEASNEVPDDVNILQDAAINSVIAGQFDDALPMARRLSKLGADVQLSGLVLIADALRREDYEAALGVLDEAETEVNPLLDGLLRGWIEAGRGNVQEVTEALEELAKDDAFGTLSQYHHALILGLVGNFDGAVALLKDGPSDGPLRVNQASTRVHAQMLMQLDRPEDAKAVILADIGDRPAPDLRALLERIESGEDVAFDYIADVKDGASEVLLTLASALGQESAERFALFYARLAQVIRPDYVDAYLFTADVFAAQEQYDLAVLDFERVPESSTEFRSALIGRANALADGGLTEEAISALGSVTTRWPDDDFAHISLGDLFRYEERFEEAAASYSDAVDLIDAPRPRDWRTYYVRGIAYERTDQWDNAEADFRKALELAPEQPLVLNYLGYSLVEKDLKIEEARDMIERAVAGDPDNGYITDSLGWVLYKLGEKDAAVPHMERATELLPTDPIINDHLGDVYWSVGRKTEAVFQWRRALSFGPEEVEAERIRQKLMVGLDAVIEQETAQNGQSE